MVIPETLVPIHLKKNVIKDKGNNINSTFEILSNDHLEIIRIDYTIGEFQEKLTQADVVLLLC
jgi:hypothetical protein